MAAIHLLFIIEAMISKEVVIEKLKNIYDPEIPVNIYDLGLIYNIEVIGTSVYLIMTLTTATCPAAAFMPEEIKTTLLQTNGIENVEVDVVYEPKWTKDKMSLAAREQLGF